MTEYLVEIFRVVEWRNGEAFTSKSDGLRWLTDSEIEEARELGFLTAAPSTNTPQPHIRRRKA